MGAVTLYSFHKLHIPVRAYDDLSQLSNSVSHEIPLNGGLACCLGSIGHQFSTNLPHHFGTNDRARFWRLICCSVHALRESGRFDHEIIDTFCKSI